MSIQCDLCGWFNPPDAAIVENFEEVRLQGEVFHVCGNCMSKGNVAEELAEQWLGDEQQ